MIFKILAFFTLFFSLLGQANYGDVSNFLSLKQEIKKVEKKLDKKKSYLILNKNTGRLRTYKITQNLVAEGCSLGIDQSIKALKSKKVLGRVIGPIFVDRWLDIYTKDFSYNNRYGYSINFNGEEPYLLFKTKEKREKALIHIFKLKRLCTKKIQLRRQLLNRGVDPLTIGEFGFGYSKKIRTLYKKQKLDWKKKSLAEIRRSFAKNLKVPEGDIFGDSALFGINHESPVEMALLGGEKSFVERYRTLLDAKKSVHITNLHMLADETGLTLGNLLLRKRLQGLDITLYLDAFIPFIDIRDLKVRENSYRLYHNFMAAGVPVYGFRCDSKSKQLKLEWKHGRKNKNETILHRHHEKLWITDGKEIIVGGANITNHYHKVEDKGRNAWRDQDILIRGKSLVQEIVKRTKEHMNTFSKNYGDPRNESCFNPYTVGSKEFNDFFKENSKEYKKPKNLEEFKKKHAFALNKVEELKNGIIEGNFFKPLFHMIKEARAIFSYPTKKELNIENAYIELIENSKDEILMANSYSVFSPEMIDALKRAALRGVKIKILTNGPETNDPPIVMTPLSRSLYKTLTEDLYGTSREIEFYEWNGRENGDEDGEINFGMIHAKYAVFDRKISLVGSYNFDSLSRNYNTEMAVVYEEEKITQELVKEFYEQDLPFSKKVEYVDMLDYHRPRSLGQRILLKILKKMEWIL